MEKWRKSSLGKTLAQKHPLIFENIEEKKEKWKFGANKLLALNIQWIFSH